MWDFCRVPRLRTPAAFFLWLASLLLLATLVTPPLCAQKRVQHSQPPERPQVKNIFWQPNEVKQGSPILISVELSGPASEVNGTWLGKRIRFTRSGQPRVWIAIAGADVGQTPGSFELRVAARMSGRVARLAKQIEVNEAQFGTGEVTVAQDYVHPTPDEERQIARD